MSPENDSPGNKNAQHVSAAKVCLCGDGGVGVAVVLVGAGELRLSNQKGNQNSSMVG